MKTYAVKSRRECGDDAPLHVKLNSPVIYYYVSVFDDQTVKEYEFFEHFATLHEAQKACEDKRRSIGK
jgi:hypothetical protein